MLAGTVGLDMAKAGWTATGDSYLGRVTKARILEAVREAKGEDAADRIAGLKKAEMVTAAEDLLVGTGWLPDPLRTPPLPDENAPEIELIDDADTADGGPSDDDPDTGEVQSAEDGGEPAIGDSDPSGEDDPVAGDAFAKTAAE
ncbi:MAG: chromosome partitioning protein, ParB family [Rhodobacteraceae bacterium HLUCCA08]|nr:MAG: chromosome partitioning protein, ParB family [Rhodobacteraceae bacterium HLUCCA08]